jgi:hypothetical protein
MFLTEQGYKYRIVTSDVFQRKEFSPKQEEQQRLINP